MKTQFLPVTLRTLTSLLSVSKKSKLDQDTNLLDLEEYPLGAELRPYVALAFIELNSNPI